MEQQNRPKRIAIMGSTGSIGEQALDVIRAHSDSFSAEVLACYANAPLLIKQALEFEPNAVVIGDENRYEEVKNALAATDVKVFAGSKSMEDIVEMDSVDMVLASIVGFAGLKSTLHAIRAGKAVALANKETLVVAGDLIRREAQSRNVRIYPVDSEHSAIFQCLAGEFHNPVEEIILTASGGPFRNFSREQLMLVKPEDALAHPNWNMGRKITVDSASLMNKGLEVIEARWLFNVDPSRISVLIHPQSIIHSMVRFCDGSVKAQLGLPDMKLPILYAFSYPFRLQTDFPRLDFAETACLTFEKPDTEKFPNLALAFRALHTAGNMPCVLNAANEAAVEAFLCGRIAFYRMPDVIEKCMQQAFYIEKPEIEDYFETDRKTRMNAEEIIKNYKI
jgi:1-deoxy-D-xylulose-5-phosphate reductoisomerase